MILMITVALTAGASFAAGDGVPAVERLWAEPGDRIGGESFLTLGLGVDDDVYFTDVSKLAEDWGMPEENRFGFIFGFNKRRECGGWMSLRGSAGNAGGPGGISRYSLDGGKIGRFGYSLDYRRGTHNYDTSSELRYPMAAPLLLTDVPELLWKAGFFKSRIRFSGRMHLRLGAEDITREGEKSSLTRGQAAAAAPALRTYDTNNRRFYGGLDLDFGRLAMDLTGSVRKVEGDRTLDARRTWADDQTTTVMNAGLTYAAGEKLDLAGRYIASKTTAEPVETGAVAMTSDLESSSTTSIIGAILRPAKATTLKLSARFAKTEADGWSDYQDVNTVDRERSRRNLRAELVHTGLAKTRLSLGWNQRTADLTESIDESATVGGAVTGTYVTESERTINTLTMKARRRMGRNLTLKAGFRTSAEETDKTGDFVFRTWGDSERDKARADVSMRARMGKGMNLDAGYQMIRDSFDYTDASADDAVKTTWDADRLFARLNWLAGEKLSLFGSVWMGKEAYLVEGYVDDGSDISAVEYDGTTVRYAPGLTWKYCSRGNLTASYELIKNTDSVENDITRWLVQLDRNVGEKMALSLAYRRYEFDENRFDDYIMDRYSVSLSSTF